MARAAYQLALANQRVHPEVIEINEFPELAERYAVQAVPLTVIDDKVAIPGAVPEQALVEQVMKVGRGGAVQGPGGAAGSSTPVQPQAPERIERGKERSSGLYIP
jgi:hypothetical protein